MTETLIVTGGAGFIGSNFIHLAARERPDWKIVNLDALTYAGNLGNLAAVEGRAGYQFLRGDVAVEGDVRRAFEAAGEGAVSVVHFAAESHVDRSIQSGLPFVRSNVMGTQVLLDVAREHGVERFLHVSTDEVYGSLGDTGFFTEETRLASEHPQLSDNGGEKGGVEPEETPVLARMIDFNVDAVIQTDDPVLAGLLEKRRQLEAQIGALRLVEDTMPAEEYDRLLEELLIELALTGRQIRGREGP